MREETGLIETEEREREVGEECNSKIFCVIIDQFKYI
jgi:hypothetical protein